jgi:hypothetical protein
MARTTMTDVIQMFGQQDAVLPETPLDIPRSGATPPIVRSSTTSVDLTDRRKVLMTFGPGRTGKTTFLRWAIERAIDHGNERLALATLDAARPTLRHFFPDTMAPPSVDQAMSWLERLLGHLIETPASAAIDFGADMTLVRMLAQIPTLHQMIEDAGISVVAVYLLSPRSADLTVLASMEESGFKPAATALILNIGAMSDATKDPELEFAQIRRHSLYRATIERGAVEVWMPRHYAAKQIEDRLIGFRAAAVGEGSRPALALFDKVRASQWLQDMDEAFAPIASWLP